MPAQRTDKERLVDETWRLARIIWRHTPPLRTAVEKDDWLQEAAAAVLELPHAPDQQGISRMLRALAARLVRRSARHALAVRLSSEQLDRFEAAGPAERRERRDVARLPIGVRRRARFMGRAMRLTLASLGKLLRRGYRLATIAGRFGIKEDSLKRMVRMWRPR